MTKDMRLNNLIIAYLLVSPTLAFAQSSLSVNWDWKLSDKCSRTSPAITVASIPEGTKMLRVKLVDHDMTSFDHGGGELAHSGGDTVTIPEGALKNYRGPCPPNFSSFGHDYEFSVRAFGEDNSTELAKGQKTKTFSSSTVKN